MRRAKGLVVLLLSRKRLARSNPLAVKRKPEALGQAEFALVLPALCLL